MQRVIITGASSGVGAALAHHYAQRGAQLALIARREKELASVASAIGGSARCYALDVRDAGALHAAARDFVDSWGCPDIVIANAGVSTGVSTEHREDLS